MLLDEPTDALFSMQAKNKLGRSCPFGLYMFGQANFGDQELFVPRSEFGAVIFGKDRFADITVVSGIFEIRHTSKGQRNSYTKYMIPNNPRTEEQQIPRANFATAVANWQALTSNQKAFYNEKAEGRYYSGYNLFIKAYLLSI